MRFLMIVFISLALGQSALARVQPHKLSGIRSFFVNKTPDKIKTLTMAAVLGCSVMLSSCKVSMPAYLFPVAGVMTAQAITVTAKSFTKKTPQPSQTWSGHYVIIGMDGRISRGGLMDGISVFTYSDDYIFGKIILSGRHNSPVADLWLHKKSNGVYFPSFEVIDNVNNLSVGVYDYTLVNFVDHQGSLQVGYVDESLGDNLLIMKSDTEQVIVNRNDIGGFLLTDESISHFPDGLQYQVDLRDADYLPRKNEWSPQIPSAEEGLTAIYGNLGKIHIFSNGIAVLSADGYVDQSTGERIAFEEGRHFYAVDLQDVEYTNR